MKAGDLLEVLRFAKKHYNDVYNQAIGLDSIIVV
uniref:Uncharacterized protein n=1 Tax=Arundo donax TaxID=35708 RepID=A0A0A8YCF2_ARUDO